MPTLGIFSNKPAHSHLVSWENIATCKGTEVDVDWLVGDALLDPGGVGKLGGLQVDCLGVEADVDWLVGDCGLVSGPRSDVVASSLVYLLIYLLSQVSWE